MKYFYSFLQWLTGKNSTPIVTPQDDHVLASIKSNKEVRAAFQEVVNWQAEFNEKRLLPIGVKEFHEWSDRIISQAMLPATAESQKFALASILLNLGPNIASEANVYFINVLRKSAVNQMAHQMANDLRDAAKVRLAKEEDEKSNLGAVTPLRAVSDEKMADKPV